MDLFLTNTQLFAAQDLMDWSGADYLWIIVMFLSAVWTHSDGTHSLQRIHCRVSDGISGRPIFCIFFKYRHWPIRFSCLADALEAGLLFWRHWERQRLSTQCWHSPSCLLLSLTALSNTDRSLSNNQIERLNKGIKIQKSILTIDFILLVISINN